MPNREKGLAQVVVAIGLAIVVLAIPLAVKLVKQRQEIRKMAQMPGECCGCHKAVDEYYGCTLPVPNGCDTPELCPPPGPICGDGSCDGNENCNSCPQDCSCPPPCQNGDCMHDCTVCDGIPYNDCVQACSGPVEICGDGYCVGNENCSNCVTDCGCPPTCSPVGGQCGSDAQCCSGYCNPIDFTCGASPPPPPSWECDETKPCGIGFQCNMATHSCERKPTSPSCTEDCGACSGVCGNGVGKKLCRLICDGVQSGGSYYQDCVNTTECPQPSCKPLNSSCTSNSECCNYSCVGGTCRFCNNTCNGIICGEPNDCGDLCAPGGGCTPQPAPTPTPTPTPIPAQSTTYLECDANSCGANPGTTDEEKKSWYCVANYQQGACTWQQPPANWQGWKCAGGGNCDQCGVGNNGWAWWGAGCDAWCTSHASEPNCLRAAGGVTGPLVTCGDSLRQCTVGDKGGRSTCINGLITVKSDCSNGCWADLHYEKCGVNGTISGDSLESIIVYYAPMNCSSFFEEGGTPYNTCVQNEKERLAKYLSAQSSAADKYCVREDPQNYKACFDKLFGQIVGQNLASSFLQVIDPSTGKVILNENALRALYCGSSSSQVVAINNYYYDCNNGKVVSLDQATMNLCQTSQGLMAWAACDTYIKKAEKECEFMVGTGESVETCVAAAKERIAKEASIERERQEQQMALVAKFCQAYTRDIEIDDCQKLYGDKIMAGFNFDPKTAQTYLAPEVVIASAKQIGRQGILVFANDPNNYYDSQTGERIILNQVTDNLCRTSRGLVPYEVCYRWTVEATRQCDREMQEGNEQGQNCLNITMPQLKADIEYEQKRVEQQMARRGDYCGDSGRGLGLTACLRLVADQIENGYSLETDEAGQVTGRLYWDQKNAYDLCSGRITSTIQDGFGNWYRCANGDLINEQEGIKLLVTDECRKKSLSANETVNLGTTYEFNCATGQIVSDKAVKNEFLSPRGQFFSQVVEALKNGQKQTTISLRDETPYNSTDPANKKYEDTYKTCLDQAVSTGNPLSGLVCQTPEQLYNQDTSRGTQVVIKIDEQTKNYQILVGGQVAFSGSGASFDSDLAQAYQKARELKNIGFDAKVVSLIDNDAFGKILGLPLGTKFIPENIVPYDPSDPANQKYLDQYQNCRLQGNPGSLGLGLNPRCSSPEDLYYTDKYANAGITVADIKTNLDSIKRAFVQTSKSCGLDFDIWSGRCKENLQTLVLGDIYSNSNAVKHAAINVGTMLGAVATGLLIAPEPTVSKASAAVIGILASVPLSLQEMDQRSAAEAIMNYNYGQGILRVDDPDSQTSAYSLASKANLSTFGWNQQQTDIYYRAYNSLLNSPYVEIPPNFDPAQITDPAQQQAMMKDMNDRPLWNQPVPPIQNWDDVVKLSQLRSGLLAYQNQVLQNSGGYQAYQQRSEELNQSLATNAIFTLGIEGGGLVISRLSSAVEKQAARQISAKLAVYNWDLALAARGGSAPLVVQFSEPSAQFLLDNGARIAKSNLTEADLSKIIGVLRPQEISLVEDFVKAASRDVISLRRVMEERNPLSLIDLNRVNPGLKLTIAGTEILEPGANKIAEGVPISEVIRLARAPELPPLFPPVYNVAPKFDAEKIAYQLGVTKEDFLKVADQYKAGTGTDIANKVIFYSRDEKLMAEVAAMAESRGLRPEIDSGDYIADLLSNREIRAMVEARILENPENIAEVQRAGRVAMKREMKSVFGRQPTEAEIQAWEAVLVKMDERLAVATGKVPTTTVSESASARAVQEILLLTSGEKKTVIVPETQLGATLEQLAANTSNRQVREAAQAASQALALIQDAAAGRLPAQISPSFVLNFPTRLPVLADTLVALNPIRPLEQGIARLANLGQNFLVVQPVVPPLRTLDAPTAAVYERVAKPIYADLRRQLAAGVSPDQVAQEGINRLTADMLDNGVPPERLGPIQNDMNRAVNEVVSGAQAPTLANLTQRVGEAAGNSLQAAREAAAGWVANNVPFGVGPFQFAGNAPGKVQFPGQSTLNTAQIAARYGITSADDVQRLETSARNAAEYYNTGNPRVLISDGSRAADVLATLGLEPRFRGAPDSYVEIVRILAEQRAFLQRLAEMKLEDGSGLLDTAERLVNEQLAVLYVDHGNSLAHPDFTREKIVVKPGLDKPALYVPDTGDLLLNADLVNGSRPAWEVLGVISHEVGHGVQEQGAAELRKNLGLTAARQVEEGIATDLQAKVLRVTSAGDFSPGYYEAWKHLGRIENDLNVKVGVYEAKEIMNALKRGDNLPLVRALGGGDETKGWRVLRGYYSGLTLADLHGGVANVLRIVPIPVVDGIYTLITEGIPRIVSIIRSRYGVGGGAGNQISGIQPLSVVQEQAVNSFSEGPMRKIVAELDYIHPKDPSVDPEKVLTERMNLVAHRNEAIAGATGDRKRIVYLGAGSDWRLAVALGDEIDMVDSSYGQKEDISGYRISSFRHGEISVMDTESDILTSIKENFPQAVIEDTIDGKRISFSIADGQQERNIVINLLREDVQNYGIPADTALILTPDIDHLFLTSRPDEMIDAITNGMRIFRSPSLSLAIADKNLGIFGLAKTGIAGLYEVTNVDRFIRYQALLRALFPSGEGEGTMFGDVLRRTIDRGEILPVPGEVVNLPNDLGTVYSVSAVTLGEFENSHPDLAQQIKTFFESVKSPIDTNLILVFADSGGQYQGIFAIKNSGFESNTGFANLPGAVPDGIKDKIVYSIVKNPEVVINAAYRYIVIPFDVEHWNSNWRIFRLFKDSLSLNVNSLQEISIDQKQIGDLQAGDRTTYFVQGTNTYQAKGIVVLHSEAESLSGRAVILEPVSHFPDISAIEVLPGSRIPEPFKSSVVQPAAGTVPQTAGTNLSQVGDITGQLQTGLQRVLTRAQELVREQLSGVERGALTLRQSPGTATAVEAMKAGKVKEAEAVSLYEDALGLVEQGKGSDSSLTDALALVKKRLAQWKVKASEEMISGIDRGLRTDAAQIRFNLVLDDIEAQFKALSLPNRVKELQSWRDSGNLDEAISIIRKAGNYYDSIEEPGYAQFFWDKAKELERIRDDLLPPGSRFGPLEKVTTPLMPWQKPNSGPITNFAEVQEYLSQQPHVQGLWDHFVISGRLPRQSAGVLEVPMPSILDAPSITNWGNIERAGSKIEGQFGGRTETSFLTFVADLRDGRVKLTDLAETSGNIKVLDLGGGVFVAIDGTNRIVAAKAAGLEKIPAEVFQLTGQAAVKPWTYADNPSEAKKVLEIAQSLTGTYFAREGFSFADIWAGTVSQISQRIGNQRFIDFADGIERRLRPASEPLLRFQNPPVRTATDQGIIINTWNSLVNFIEIHRPGRFGGTPLEPVKVPAEKIKPSVQQTGGNVTPPEKPPQENSFVVTVKEIARYLGDVNRSARELTPNLFPGQTWESLYVFPQPETLYLMQRGLLMLATSFIPSNTPVPVLQILPALNATPLPEIFYMAEKTVQLFLPSTHIFPPMGPQNLIPVESFNQITRSISILAQIKDLIALGRSEPGVSVRISLVGIDRQTMWILGFLTAPTPVLKISPWQLVIKDSAEYQKLTREIGPALNDNEKPGGFLKSIFGNFVMVTVIDSSNQAPKAQIIFRSTGRPLKRKEPVLILPKVPKLVPQVITRGVSLPVGVESGPLAPLLDRLPLPLQTAISRVVNWLQTHTSWRFAGNLNVPAQVPSQALQTVNQMTPQEARLATELSLARITAVFYGEAKDILLNYQLTVQERQKAIDDLLAILPNDSLRTLYKQGIELAQQQLTFQADWLAQRGDTALRDLLNIIFDGYGLSAEQKTAHINTLLQYGQKMGQTGQEGIRLVQVYPGLPIIVIDDRVFDYLNKINILTSTTGGATFIARNNQEISFMVLRVNDLGRIDRDTLLHETDHLLNILMEKSGFMREVNESGTLTRPFRNFRRELAATVLEPNRDVVRYLRYLTPMDIDSNLHDLVAPSVLENMALAIWKAEVVFQIAKQRGIIVDEFYYEIAKSRNFDELFNNMADLLVAHGVSSTDILRAGGSLISLHPTSLSTWRSAADISILLLEKSNPGVLAVAKIGDGLQNTVRSARESIGQFLFDRFGFGGPGITGNRGPGTVQVPANNFLTTGSETDVFNHSAQTYPALVKIAEGDFSIRNIDPRIIEFQKREAVRFLRRLGDLGTSTNLELSLEDAHTLIAVNYRLRSEGLPLLNPDQITEQTVLETWRMYTRAAAAEEEIPQGTRDIARNVASELRSLDTQMGFATGDLPKIDPDAVLATSTETRGQTPALGVYSPNLRAALIISDNTNRALGADVASARTVTEEALHAGQWQMWPSIEARKAALRQIPSLGEAGVRWIFRRWEGSSSMAGPDLTYFFHSYDQQWADGFQRLADVLGEKEVYQFARNGNWPEAARLYDEKMGQQGAFARDFADSSDTAFREWARETFGSSQISPAENTNLAPAAVVSGPLAGIYDRLPTPIQNVINGLIDRFGFGGPGITGNRGPGTVIVPSQALQPVNQMTPLEVRLAIEAKIAASTGEFYRGVIETLTDSNNTTEIKRQKINDLLAILPDNLRGLYQQGAEQIEADFKAQADLIAQKGESAKDYLLHRLADTNSSKLSQDQRDKIVLELYPRSQLSEIYPGIPMLAVNGEAWDLAVQNGMLDLGPEGTLVVVNKNNNYFIVVKMNPTGEIDQNVIKHEISHIVVSKFDQNGFLRPTDETASFEDIFKTFRNELIAYTLSDPDSMVEKLRMRNSVLARWGGLIYLSKDKMAETPKEVKDLVERVRIELEIMYDLAKLNKIPADDFIYEIAKARNFNELIDNLTNLLVAHDITFRDLMSAQTTASMTDLTAIRAILDVSTQMFRKSNPVFLTVSNAVNNLQTGIANFALRFATPQQYQTIANSLASQSHVLTSLLPQFRVFQIAGTALNGLLGTTQPVPSVVVQPTETKLIQEAINYYSGPVFETKSAEELRNSVKDFLDFEVKAPDLQRILSYTGYQSSEELAQAITDQIIAVRENKAQAANLARIIDNIRANIVQIVTRQPRVSTMDIPIKWPGAVPVVEKTIIGVSETQEIERLGRMAETKTVQNFYGVKYISGGHVNAVLDLGNGKVLRIRTHDTNDIQNIRIAGLQALDPGWEQILPKIYEIVWLPQNILDVIQKFMSGNIKTVDIITYPKGDPHAYFPAAILENVSEATGYLNNRSAFIGKNGLMSLNKELSNTKPKPKRVDSGEVAKEAAIRLEQLRVVAQEVRFAVGFDLTFNDIKETGGWEVVDGHFTHKKFLDYDLMTNYSLNPSQTLSSEMIEMVRGSGVYNLAPFSYEGADVLLDNMDLLRELSRTVNFDSAQMGALLTIDLRMRLFKLPDEVKRRLGASEEAYQIGPDEVIAIADNVSQYQISFNDYLNAVEKIKEAKRVYESEQAAKIIVLRTDKSDAVKIATWENSNAGREFLMVGYHLTDEQLSIITLDDLLKFPSGAVEKIKNNNLPLADDIKWILENVFLYPKKGLSDFVPNGLNPEQLIEDYLLYRADGLKSIPIMGKGNVDELTAFAKNIVAAGERGEIPIDEIPAEIKNLASGEIVIPTIDLDNQVGQTGTIISGGLGPFSAQWFETLANSLIYSRWPEARTRGLIPVIIDGIRARFGGPEPAQVPAEGTQPSTLLLPSGKTATWVRIGASFDNEGNYHVGINMYSTMSRRGSQPLVQVGANILNVTSFAIHVPAEIDAAGLKLARQKGDDAEYLWYIGEKLGWKFDPDEGWIIPASQIEIVNTQQALELIRLKPVSAQPANVVSGPLAGVINRLPPPVRRVVDWIQSHLPSERGALTLPTEGRQIFLSNSRAMGLKNTDLANSAYDDGILALTKNPTNINGAVEAVVQRLKFYKEPVNEKVARVVLTDSLTRDAGTLAKAPTQLPPEKPTAKNPLAGLPTDKTVQIQKDIESTLWGTDVDISMLGDLTQAQRHDLAVVRLTSYLKQQVGEDPYLAQRAEWLIQGSGYSKNFVSGDLKDRLAIQLGRELSGADLDHIITLVKGNEINLFDQLAKTILPEAEKATVEKQNPTTFQRETTTRLRSIFLSQNKGADLWKGLKAGSLEKAANYLLRGGTIESFFRYYVFNRIKQRYEPVFLAEIEAYSLPEQRRVVDTGFKQKISSMSKILDKDKVWWKFGPESVEWYYWDGTKWVKSNLRPALPQESWSWTDEIHASNIFVKNTAPESPNVIKPYIPPRNVVEEELQALYVPAAEFGKISYVRPNRGYVPESELITIDGKRLPLVGVGGMDQTGRRVFDLSPIGKSDLVLKIDRPSDPRGSVISGPVESNNLAELARYFNLEPAKRGLVNRPARWTFSVDSQGVPFAAIEWQKVTPAKWEEVFFSKYESNAQRGINLRSGEPYGAYKKIDNIDFSPDEIKAIFEPQLESGQIDLDTYLDKVAFRAKTDPGDISVDSPSLRLWYAQDLEGNWYSKLLSDNLVDAYFPTPGKWQRVKKVVTPEEENFYSFLMLDDWRKVSNYGFDKDGKFVATDFVSETAIPDWYNVDREFLEGLVFGERPSGPSFTSSKPAGAIPLSAAGPTALAQGGPIGSQIVGGVAWVSQKILGDANPLTQALFRVEAAVIARQNIPGALPLRQATNMGPQEGLLPGLLNRLHGGTSQPAQVPASKTECVTGDTTLPIVQLFNCSIVDKVTMKQCGNETIEFRQIKDIKGGEYILSLNEETGKLEPHKIISLLDKGVQEVYRLTTKDGRTIETTENHPYLIKNLVTPTFENQNASDNNHNDSENSQIGISVSGHLTSLSSQKEKPNQNQNNTADNSSQQVSISKIPFNHDFTPFTTDNETQIKASVIINPIAKNSKNSNKVTGRINNGEITPNENQATAIFPAISELALSWPIDNLPIKNNLTQNQDRVNGIWTKVIYLKPGMEIAVASFPGGSSNIVFQKIASIVPSDKKQVYDIEVEGTHNFVGNGIVAHNTRIESGPMGQAGQGIGQAGKDRGAKFSPWHALGLLFSAMTLGPEIYTRLAWCNNGITLSSATGSFINNYDSTNSIKDNVKFAYLDLIASSKLSAAAKNYLLFWADTIKELGFNKTLTAMQQGAIPNPWEVEGILRSCQNQKQVATQIQDKYRSSTRIYMLLANPNFLQDIKKKSLDKQKEEQTYLNNTIESIPESLENIKSDAEKAGLAQEYSRFESSFLSLPVYLQLYVLNRFSALVYGRQMYQVNPQTFNIFSDFARELKNLGLTVDEQKLIYATSLSGRDNPIEDDIKVVKRILIYGNYLYGDLTTQGAFIKVDNSFTKSSLLFNETIKNIIPDEQKTKYLELIDSPANFTAAISYFKEKTGDKYSALILARKLIDYAYASQNVPDGSIWNNPDAFISWLSAQKALDIVRTASSLELKFAGRMCYGCVYNQPALPDELNQYQNNAKIQQAIKLYSIDQRYSPESLYFLLTAQYVDDKPIQALNFMEAALTYLRDTHSKNELDGIDSSLLLSEIFRNIQIRLNEVSLIQDLENLNIVVSNKNSSNPDLPIIPLKNDISYVHQGQASDPGMIINATLTTWYPKDPNLLILPGGINFTTDLMVQELKINGGNILTKSTYMLIRNDGNWEIRSLTPEEASGVHSVKDLESNLSMYGYKGMFSILPVIDPKTGKLWEGGASGDFIAQVNRDDTGAVLVAIDPKTNLVVGKYYVRVPSGKLNNDTVKYFQDFLKQEHPELGGEMKMNLILPDPGSQTAIYNNGQLTDIIAGSGGANEYSIGLSPYTR